MTGAQNQTSAQHLGDLWAAKHCFTNHGLQVGGACAAATSFYRGLEAEHRFAPARAPNWFLTMPPKGVPKLEEAWPSDDKSSSIWLFLMRNDSPTILLTTKHGQLMDPDFLDLPSTFDAPMQRHIDRVGQAEWRIEKVDRKESGQIGQVRLLHVSSGRYLAIANFRKTVINKKHTSPPEEQVPVLTSCAPTTCEKHSTEFNMWPRTEYPLSD